MNEVFTLALPFFGLIFLGFASGKIAKLPETGLAWLNFFVVYVSLPSLFFKLVAQTPLEELTNWSFVAATTFATYTIFAIAFVYGLWVAGGRIAEASILALAGSYSNIGYMGPGLTLAALGAGATVPTAIIFCFDSMLLFTLLPIMMALGGEEKQGWRETILFILKRVFLHPFILATILGFLAAGLEFQPRGWIDKMLTILSGAAAPCALFAMGVTVALRRVKRIPGELAILLPIKLIIHPLLIYAILTYIGGIPTVWVYTAMLMACLPPAANVFVMAQQYDIYLDQASSAVMIGTLISVATVTAFLYFITQGMLPA